MHVVDVTLFFAPHSGGVKRYLLSKQAWFATQRGTRHTLLVPGDHSRRSENGRREVASSRIPFGGGYRLPLRMRPWADALRELEPDLIEAGDPYHLAWMALDVGQRIGVPVAAFAHSDLARLLGDRFAPALGRLAARYLRNLYRRFDRVFAPSRLIAERLGDLGLDNIGLQPLGVDGDVFHPGRADGRLRSELGLPESTRLLVFAGRLAREKEVPLLLKTFARLGAPYHLLLVGGERSGHVAANVTMLAYQQDGRALARLIASCDALIHAGRHETFGLVLLEAMACGRPVVAVRAGAMTELVGTDSGVLAAPGDDAALADAVRQLYALDRDQMGACARRRVEAEHLWEVVLPRLQQRYLDLVRARSCPTREDREKAVRIAGSGVADR